MRRHYEWPRGRRWPTASSGGKGWRKHAKELCNGEAELRARGIKLSCYGGDKIDQRIEMVGDEQEGKKRKGSYGLSLS